LFCCCKYDYATSFAGACCAARAVKIIFVICWCIYVDNERDSIYVDTAGGDVGCDEGSVFLFFK
jgi:hypothetical protein